MKLTVEDSTIGYAALDWEEYSDWWRNLSDEKGFKKTLVVYSEKGKVVGKSVVVLSKNPAENDHNQQF